MGYSVVSPRRTLWTICIHPPDSDHLSFNFQDPLILYSSYRRGTILKEANSMSGVFQNIDPPPPHRLANVYPPPPAFGAGEEDTFAGGRGDGGSIVWKTPEPALYSTVSTLWFLLSVVHPRSLIVYLHKPAKLDEKRRHIVYFSLILLGVKCTQSITTYVCTLY
jgi:hypothetical protein